MIKKSRHAVTLIGWACLVCFYLSPAHAMTVIWDQSPDTIGGTLTRDDWANGPTGQNFADPVMFVSETTVTGMDVYTGSTLFAGVGDSATIRIRSDSHLGPLTELVEIITIDDTDGTTLTGGLHRFHVDFTAPVALMGGVEYWVGMSCDFCMQAGFMNGVGPLLDNQTATYFGTTFDNFASDVGDTAFRLWGAAVVPIPGAAWLFASALGVFGYLGKRRANAY